jgi:hypothetical protein
VLIADTCLGFIQSDEMLELSSTFGNRLGGYCPISYRQSYCQGCPSQKKIHGKQFLSDLVMDIAPNMFRETPTEIFWILNSTSDSLSRSRFCKVKITSQVTNLIGLNICYKYLLSFSSPRLRFARLGLRIARTAFGCWDTQAVSIFRFTCGGYFFGHDGLFY